MQGQLFTQDFLLRGIRETPPYQSIDGAALSRFRGALESIYQPLRADSNLNEGRLTRPPEPNLALGSLECRMQRVMAGRELAVVAAISDEDPAVIVVTAIVLDQRN